MQHPTNKNLALIHWPFSHAWPGCFFSSMEYSAATADLAADLPQSVPATGSGKRRSEYIAGRICARQALRQFMPGAAMPGRQAGGRAPLWPEGSCGSISHSHGTAVAIAASQQHWHALGIDLERCVSTERARRLAKSVLSQTEIQLCARLGWAENEFFTCAFSAKESLFKLLNPLTGCYFGFQDVQLCALNADGSFGLQLQRQIGHWPTRCRFNGQWTRFAQGFITASALLTPTEPWPIPA